MVYAIDASGMTLSEGKIVDGRFVVSRHIIQGLDDPEGAPVFSTVEAAARAALERLDADPYRRENCRFTRTNLERLAGLSGAFQPTVRRKGARR